MIPVKLIRIEMIRTITNNTDYQGKVDQGHNEKHYIK